MTRSVNTKRGLANFALFVITLGVSLVLAEIALRVMHPAKEPVSEESFYRHDPLLGWCKVPGQSGWIFHDEFQVLEEVNSRGIRGPEYPYEKPANEFRILILGDSFSEGYTVGFEKLFSERLKDSLNRRCDGRSYQVINAGTRAFSTDQELLFFESEGRKYSPDIVVLMFCENDVWFNTQLKYLHYYKPLFRLKDGGLELANVPVPQPDISWMLGGKRKVRLGDWLASKSRVYASAIRLLERISWFEPRQEMGMAERIWDRQLEPLQEELRYGVPIPNEFGVWQRKSPPSVRYAWKLTEVLLGRLRDRVKEGGAELIVFHIPTRENIYPSYWKAAKSFYGIREPDWDVERVAKDLAAVCRRQSIRFVSPTETFKEEAAKLEESGQRLYNTLEAHWNENGHELVGRILSKYIEESLLVGAAHEPPLTHRAESAEGGS
ncbi:MAG: SGNH/GDSL hydrolase family protein [Candidatus Coatesbacteria bacterium]|nr:SGNH/GDSL hydrolase family protein [Candidatus Coatesbacteria bacterium]